VLSRHVTLPEVRLHVGEAGAGPPVLLLHGFPEYSGTWRKQMAALSPRWRCIAPDQRGYARSDKPADVAAFAVPTLLGDIDALLDALGLESVALAGHDWGGVLAWWYAATRPERVSRLAVFNAPHPVAFQHRLETDAAQQKASAYLDRLRAPGGDADFAAQGAEGLWKSMFASNPAFGTDDKAGFIAAWSQRDALAAPVRWYAASPFRLGAGATEWHLAARLEVAVPVLIVWGMRDRVFVPELVDDSAAFCRDVRIVRIADAGHAVLHERPDAVNAALADFLAGSN
jgi:epoxide hydrolase 4